MRYLVLMAPLISFYAQACSCKLKDDATYYAEADTVFVAKVTGKRRADSDFKFSIETIQLLKGTQYENVSSAAGFAEATSCDYHLEEGDIYLFMLNTDNSVTYCSGTRPIKTSEIERFKKEVLSIDS